MGFNHLTTETIRPNSTRVLFVEPVTAASRGLTNGLPPLKLSDAYFVNAGEIAQQQAKLTGLRLS